MPVVRAERWREYDRRRSDSPDLAVAHDLRSSGRWKRFRAWYAAAHPLCADPLGLHPDVPEPTADVHHVVPLAVGTTSHALSLDNCLPVCRVCHARLHARLAVAQEGAR